MRKAVLLGLVVIFGVLAISAVALADRGKGKSNGNGKNFSARLNGWEEDPSQVTTGTGRFRATANTTSIAFELRYENLEGTNVVQAHIHIGSRHESGGIAAWLCGGTTQPACPAGPTRDSHRDDRGDRHRRDHAHQPGHRGRRLRRPAPRDAQGRGLRERPHGPARTRR